MSAITAIADLDGGPIDETLIDRMLDRVAYRGKYRRVARPSSSIAIGARGRCDADGFLASDDQLVVVIDGRIDNGDEVAAACSLAGHVPVGRGAAEVVRCAYRTWQIDAFERLLGDFAAVIWDGRRRTLVAARDVFGMRPLCYAAVDASIALGSEVQQIVAAPWVARRSNAGFFAEYLANRITSRHETLYSQVFRLPAAHVLVASKDGVTTERYWELAPADEQDVDDADAQGEFRELLRQSVKARLADRGRTGILLSGGVDSSSITVTAAALVSSGAISTDLRAYSHVYDSIPRIDERSYMRDVVEATGVAWTPVPYAPANVEIYRDETQRFASFPSCTGAASWTTLRERAASDGCTTLLHGLGGDEWFTGSLYHSTDLLRRGRLVAAGRQLLADSRTPDTAYTLWSVTRTAAWPLVPAPFRGAINAVVNPSRAAPRGLTAKLLDDTCLIDRIRTPNFDGRFSTYAAGGVYADAMSPTQLHGWELDERMTGAAGVDLACPLFDRRLAEFAIRLPERLRWSGPVTKVIVRRALRDALPPSVVRRRTKPGDGIALIDHMAAPDGRAVLTGMRLAAEGWIDQREVDAMLAEAIEGARREDPRADVIACRLFPIFIGEIIWTTLFA